MPIFYAFINLVTLTERYCQDPDPPSTNGGLSDWNTDMKDVTPFNTIVTYSCDTARQLMNSSAENYTSIYNAIYPSQTRVCQWDQTWFPAEPVTFEI